MFEMKVFHDVSIKQKRFTGIRSDVNGISMLVFVIVEKYCQRTARNGLRKKKVYMRNKQKNYKRFLKNSPTSQ